MGESFGVERNSEEKTTKNVLIGVNFDRSIFEFFAGGESERAPRQD